MRMKKLLLLVFSTVAFCVAQAQVTTSSIHGKVVDDNRKPVVGATVIAVHTPTGTEYAVATSRDGMFNLGGMRVGGPYDITISFVGCNDEKYSNVYLTIGEDAQFNTTLHESSTDIGEVVVVGTANPVFNSNRTGAQEIISRDMMDKLPTVNRSLTDYTRLTPMSSGSNFAGTSYRFNNVTVDGASFNNSFGLSASLGASGIEPISLESIEQVQVMIAPYDVRNGGFTGGGINSVTKSGSNEWEASAYFYKKSPSMTGYRVKDYIGTVKEFTSNQYGLSLSGPIIKNKLFFFLNGELDRIEEPINYTTKNSVPTPEALQDLSDFLGTELGYNPGKFDVSKTETYGDRLTARIDWNINSKNTFSVKYYYLKSYNTNNPSTSGKPRNGRGPNAYAIPYSSSFYRTNNNFHIVMADLNTTVNDRMSNTLKFGYSRLRDYRDMDGGFFPQVDILDGNRNSYTVFGTEANSYNNQLDTDIFQIQDNFTINAGKHQIVIGTQSDYRSFRNGFAQNFPGTWVFSSIDDFKFNALAAKQYRAQHGSMEGFNIKNFNPADFGLTGVVNGGIPNSAGTGYSYYNQKFTNSEKYSSFPFAEVNVVQLGFYVQDKWSPSHKFNLTYGLRVDVPIFVTDLQTNEKVAGATFRDGIKIDVSKYPNAHPQFSPRLGFNWKPLEDGSLQVRGGTGLFTGTPPYVWISNQAGNNGVLFTDVNLKGNALQNLGFTGNIDEYNWMAAAGNADISITDPDFKYPMLWKTNVAIDYKWRGWVLTWETLYSKDVNAIYHDNINLEMATQNVNDGAPNSKRTAFTGSYISNNEGANNVVMLRNTSKGYSIYNTIQLQKSFTEGLFRGLGINASYSFGTSRSVTDGTSSVALSAWKYTPKVAVNSEEVGYSAGAFDGRLLLSAYYTARWGKHGATNIGLVYQRYRPYRYSYCYDGDANGDRQTSNDLIYIPRDRSEVEGHLVKGSFSSVDEAWEAMDAFIAQDAYLSKHRGEYAKRNGGVAPYANQLDLSISHDIILPQRNGRKHTLRFSFNIDNFLNLLNKDWGVSYSQLMGTNGQQYQFLKVVQNKDNAALSGVPSAANNYTLQYEMVGKAKDYLGKDMPLNKTFKPNIGSYWTMQFGIKYMFN